MEAERRTPVRERSNLVHWFAGRVHRVLDEVMGLSAADALPSDQASSPAPTVCVASLSPAQTAEAIVELDQAIARMQGLRSALLVHADTVDVAGQAGATSTAAWYSYEIQATRGEAKRAVKLATRLTDPGHKATATALLTGAVDVGRAMVVVDAVDALPASVGVEDRAHAEAHLLKEATRHNAKDQAHLGKHLHHVIDPDAADAELATALDALASPQRPDPIRREAVGADGVTRPVPAPELLGQAFRQWIDRLPADGLPVAGGSNATVVVTMTLETLLGGVTAASLDTGDLVSASQARVLACQAGVIPAVLGSKSQILDLGRRVRFHTKAQRIAVAHRDRHCTALGCTVPAAWCHVHHKTPWSQGGRTTVKDGTLLCSRHHTLVHHPDYQVTYRTDGRTQITRSSRRRP